MFSNDRTRYRGCLLGGAVGDALGYSVEFCRYDEIVKKYGESGIVSYALNSGRALISDDTQMTLFTATALLEADMCRIFKDEKEVDVCEHIWRHYLDWFKTQMGGKRTGKFSWLNRVLELNARRAPGFTCLSALGEGTMGTFERRLNNSKGCGGIMRVAPIGLYCAYPENGEISEESLISLELLAARAAAVTHSHELGYIPAAGLAHIVALASHNPDLSMLDIIKSARNGLERRFSRKFHTSYLLSLIDRAIELAGKYGLDDVEAISKIGEGWVAEETLAIAIYCSLKYESDFAKGIVAAVNHSGDSDSTGEVTGNILGAYLGDKAIPEKYLTNLECREIISEVADDLFQGIPDIERCGPELQRKYRPYIWNP